jgi:hypothetical protein
MAKAAEVPQFHQAIIISHALNFRRPDYFLLLPLAYVEARESIPDLYSPSPLVFNSIIQILMLGGTNS